MSRVKVAIVLGTRPEAIKLLPLFAAMEQSSKLEPVLISTGQHKEMLNNIFELFGVRPDIELDVMRPDQTLSELTSRLFSTLGSTLSASAYRSIVVQGDTTTALVGAIVGHYNRIPVGHVEAGLRTYNKWAPYPEECNRKMIAAVTDFHFTPTQTASEALAKEGISHGVYQVGNTVVDSLLKVHDLVRDNLPYYTEKYAPVISPDHRTILVTGHRRESFGEGFRQICRALLRIASQHPELNIVYPVHMNPNVKRVVFEMLSSCANIRLIEPVPYDEMVYLMSRAWLILTDSGGIQEEAPSLDVPVIVMRETTERPEGVEVGCSVLGGVSEENIYASFLKLYESPALYTKMSAASNPYGDGKASDRVVSILEKELNQSESQ